MLIADNTCLCGSGEKNDDKDAETCVSDLPCEAQEPIMADDGSGADVSIPSFLVHKSDADAIKTQLLANHPVRVEMAWSLPKPDDRVEYDLWTVPGDAVSHDFLHNFKLIAVGLAQHAYFTPHMYIYDGVRSNCVGGQGVDNTNMCANLCTNNGRYCATDPDGDKDKGVSGADVVKESLRRICIWDNFGRQDGIGAKWWDYVQVFERLCQKGQFNDPNCVNEVFRITDINPDLIERCMHDSGGLDGDVPNNKLDLEIAKATEGGVVVLPMAYVNESPVRGALTPTNIFMAICDGYAPGTEPVMCRQCSRCPIPLDCAETGFCTNTWEHHIIDKMHRQEEAGVTGRTFFWTTFLSLVGVIGMGVGFYVRARNEMRDHVLGVLADYMPLHDDAEANNINSNDVPNPMVFGQNISTSPLMNPEDDDTERNQRF